MRKSNFFTYSRHSDKYSKYYQHFLLQIRFEYSISVSFCKIGWLIVHVVDFTCQSFGVIRIARSLRSLVGLQTLGLLITLLGVSASASVMNTQSAAAGSFVKTEWGAMTRWKLDVTWRCHRSVFPADGYGNALRQINRNEMRASGGDPREGHPSRCFPTPAEALVEVLVIEHDGTSTTRRVFNIVRALALILYKRELLKLFRNNRAIPLISPIKR